MADLEVLSCQPEGPARPTPVLFVHGAWQGAWCWKHFLPYFAAHGYSAHALNLRGHGASPSASSIRWHSIMDYVADVARVVATLPAPPFLVGHSMGGFVVQKFLETSQLPGAVLMASVPAAGSLGFGLRTMRRQPGLYLKSVLTFSPRVYLETLPLMRRLLFSADMPDELLQPYFERVQQASVRMLFEAMLLKRPRPARVTTPVLVLGAADDAIFTQDEVRATGRAYRGEARIFPNMAHNMMLERGWREVADAILTWLDGR